MQRQPWTLERLQKAALEYSNRTLFARGNPSAYSAAHKRKILDDICGHMIAKQAPRRTDEELFAKAKEFKRHGDFRKQCPSYYQSAHIRGILAEVTAHMTPRPNGTSPEEYIKYFTNKWGKNFNLIGNYEKSNIRVQVSCNIHKDYTWLAMPFDIHCKKCGIEELKLLTRMTHERYIAELPQNITVLGNYTGAHDKLLHRCLQCGFEWSTKPNSIRSGRGCVRCSLNMMTKEQCEEKIKIKHNDSIKMIGNYTMQTHKTLMRCNKGHEWLTMPHSIMRGIGCPRCYSANHKSKPEENLSIWIENLNFDVIRNTRSIIPPLELDIYIPSKNLAIEFNGTYWHSLKPADYHLSKTLACEALGIRLIHVWEHEAESPIIRSIIANALGVPSRTVYARQCDVVNVPWHVAAPFLDQNHVQGRGAASSINLALVLDGEPVAMMTFGKPRFKPITTDWELIRYACALDTRVTGGASRLFKHRPYGSIVTYSDRRLFDGSLYAHLGFDKNRIGEPGYFHCDNYGNVVLRYASQRSKLPELLGAGFDPKLSETENMLNNGYMKVWDCGTIRWVFNP